MQHHRRLGRREGIDLAFALLIPPISIASGVATAAVLLQSYSQLATSMRSEFNKYFLSNTSSPTRRTTCDKQLEEKKGGHSIDLDCGGDGSKVDQVLFASYGTPSGDCTGGPNGNNNFSVGACALDATAWVQSNCVGESSCTLPVSDSAIGTDPCVGTIKQLAVAVNCTPRMVGRA